MHILNDPLHDFDRTDGAGHDTATQAGEVEFIEVRVFQFCDEHGRNAMHGGAFFGFDCPQNGERVEYFDRHHRRTMCDADHHTQHAAETVKEGHRDA